MTPLRSIICGLLFVALCAGAAAAQTRRALVIGIDNYQNVPKLQKAVGDAHAMKAKLEQLGFTVDIITDPDYRALNSGLFAFAQKLQRGDVALLHYSGHGVTLDGENYLLPADVPSPASADKELLKASGLTLTSVIERLRAPGTSAQLLIIDACRDNPFAKNSTRAIGIEGGLGEPVSRPKGTFIIYSAGIAQTAIDRLSDADPEPTSVFMRALLAKMSVEGKSIIDLVREVREDVDALASSMKPPHEQRPAYYDELAGNFYFVPPGGVVAVVPTRPQPPQPPHSPGPNAPSAQPVQPPPSGALLPPAQSAAVPVAMARPSFDCKLAHATDELAICSNEALAALDRRLSSLYYGLADTLSGDARLALRREQGAWLGRRRACGDAVPCLGAAYNTRIAELQQRATGISYSPPGTTSSRPAAAPLPVAARPSFDCRSAKQPDELAICADATLAAKDVALAALYGQLKAGLSADARRQLGAAQGAWLRSRAQCGSAAACVGQAYDQRIRELQAQLAGR